MEACILRSSDPEKALSLIKEARQLYQEYEINSIPPALKYEMVEISLQAVVFEKHG
jgi:predicted RNase H-like HicB family nuclease